MLNSGFVSPSDLPPKAGAFIGERVARVLDRLLENRGKPVAVVSDNGPEFISRALDAWAYRQGVELRFIRPGKPIENCYVESFNGKFRDECLNQHWFVDLGDARRTIEAWRLDYNQVRPHSSLGNLAPQQFSEAALRSSKQDLRAASEGDLKSLEN